jgi:hypothetical protein
MLNSFVTTFNYSEFEKKLKHYFTDTAPVYASIKLGLREITITCYEISFSLPVDDFLSVKDNINYIIKRCEEFFYPKMLEILKKGSYGVFSTVQIQDMLLQGLTLEQIHKKQNKKILNYFTITRFNTAKNTIDFREETSGHIFRAHFNRPLITSRDYILQLSKGGQAGMNELYHLIMDNSRIEELEEKDAKVPANSD